MSDNGGNVEVFVKLSVGTSDDPELQIIHGLASLREHYDDNYNHEHGDGLPAATWLRVAQWFLATCSISDQWNEVFKGEANGEH